jgi:hypothetical protein
MAPHYRSVRGAPCAAAAEASIGATRAQEGLRVLEGLSEGFRKL